MCRGNYTLRVKASASGQCHAIKMQLIKNQNSKIRIFFSVGLDGKDFSVSSSRARGRGLTSLLNVFYCMWEGLWAGFWRESQFICTFVEYKWRINLFTRGTFHLHLAIGEICLFCENQNGVVKSEKKMSKEPETFVDLCCLMSNKWENCY